MPDLQRIVREVSWHDLFPWLLLLRTCRLAAEFRRLLLAGLGILLTAGGWWVIEGSLLADTARVPASPPASAPAADIYPASPHSAILYVPWRETVRAFTANWQWATRPVRTLFGRNFTFSSFLAAGLAGAWALAVWGILGGAICRLSAVQLGLDEQVTVASAVKFTLRKWSAYLAAPLMPLGMVVLLTLPLAAAGFVLRLDLGLLVAGLFWPLAIVSGVLIMLLVAGLALGLPLMWATISTDGTDSFDAVSRGYTYVGQRPLNYLFYLLVSVAIGVLGWMIINTLAGATIYLTGWGVSWGSGEARWRQIEATRGWLSATDAARFPLAAPPVLPPPGSSRPMEGIAGAGARLIAFWTDCVRLLAVAYAYSFFWTAYTGIFLLLRRDADAMELDEVLVEGEDDPAALPPIKPDAAGVNVLADEPPA
jgi:hypothetical protein